MSRSLYDEAIEAAEELKNATEQKVTQNLIESITPKIKSIIESKIFNEASEIEEDPDECGIGEASEIEEDPDECGIGETYEVTESARKTLGSLMSEDVKINQLRSKLDNVRSSVKSLKKAAHIARKFKKLNENSEKFNYLYKNLLKELRIIKTYNIFKKDTEIQREFLEISKELINMSTRRSRRRYLNENIEDLFEMNLFEEEEGDMPDLDAMGDDDDDAPSGDDMPDLDAMSDDDDDAPSDSDDDLQLGQFGPMSLDDILSAASEALGESDEDDAGMQEESVFYEADEGAGCSEDEDMREVEEAMEEMMGAEEGADPMESLGEIDELAEELEEMYGESYRRDRVLEIDENMLRREIGRMKALREGEAKDMASHFGGGSLEGEVFVDGVELNKLHEMKIKAVKVIRKNRMLESKLSQYKKALRGMKGQLVEMNLFNAKLLYANKLMQNRDLSIKQQRHIVESLDEAKTLGEAKILFESLSKSQVTSNRRSTGNLTESVNRRRSSASSAVRSAQPMNESVALDRWATLAGIKK